MHSHSDFQDIRTYSDTSHMLIQFSFLSSSINTQVMDGHASRVFSLKYHPTDPNLLISGGWDDTVQVCSVNTSAT